jgi:hypothetical protein
MASEMSNLSFASVGNEKPRETSRAARESLAERSTGFPRTLIAGLHFAGGMRRGSAGHFALDETGESKWTK